MSETIKLVMVRHGQSQWNLENRFTGWVDVDITELGVQQSIEAAKKLKENNFTFDVCYTSLLKRVVRTSDIILKEMNLNIPIIKHWRLMERYYGGLTGFNKSELEKEKGEEQVQIWRRSYDVRPPEISKKSEYYPGNMKLFDGIPREFIPTTESLKDTIARVRPYWEEEIKPAIKSGKNVLFVGHGNSIRAIIKIIDNVSDEEIPKIESRIGIPLIYELDENMKPIRHYYLE